MSFITDKQTLDDLNLLGKYKNSSVFNIFNKAHTAGGEQLLEEMFKNPLTDAAEINLRSNIFNYFHEQASEFPFDSEQIAIAENYLHDEAGGSLFAIGFGVFRKQVLTLTIKDDQYDNTIAGIKATIAILNTLYDFVNSLNNLKQGHPYLAAVEKVNKIIGHEKLKWIKNKRDIETPGFLAVVKYERLFRNVHRNEMNDLLQLIHYLDVYMAVAQVANERSFSYARALPEAVNQITAKELRHPGIDKAVGNEVSFTQSSNMIFLTGANMAGKSTFMKSFGVAVYLAHMGFPVAAAEMTFSIMNGIYSSINVPDDLNLGLSHFYAEVLRVKTVATEVNNNKNLVVIFDELFKGTNVKDAYDATLAVSVAFAKHTNCHFIISTHIIEVGEALQVHNNIRFFYLPTVMEGSKPRYTYRLQKGVTSDRQGMIIINNEKILELLKEDNSKK